MRAHSSHRAVSPRLARVVGPSKSSGGADSPHWTDRGHFKIIGASAPRRSRPMAVGSSGCPLFQKPPEDKDRIMTDSMPVMAWRCRPDGLVEFFNRLGSTACPCTRRLDGDGRSPFTPIYQPSYSKELCLRLVVS